jgi:hypothetical protein
MLEARGKAASECGAPTKAGGVCRNGRVFGLSACVQHVTADEAPQLVAARDAWRQEGGYVASRQRVLDAATYPIPRLDSAEDVRRVAAETIHRVETGAIGPAVANSVFQGLGVVLKLEELVQGATLARLEKMVAQRAGTRGWH